MTRNEGVVNHCVVRAQKVSKRFGNQRVIDNLELEIVPGEIVLLLGANGAGKSTLLRVLSGLSNPDSGRVHLSQGARVDFVGTGLQLYPRLSVAENLRLFSTLGNALKDYRMEIQEWGLERYSDKPVMTLSKGNQWKVALARTFLSPPDLLLLDEPTSNLDDASVEVLLHKVKEGVKGPKQSVLIASHDVARLHSSISRVLFLCKGKIGSDSGITADPTCIQSHIDEYRRGNR